MIKSRSFKCQLMNGMEEMDGEWRRTHSSAGILYFNLKGEKLTFKFCFCFIKRQIPVSVFDLKEEICQCPWLFPGDIAILRLFPGRAGSVVCPQFCYLCSSMQCSATSIEMLIIICRVC